MHGIISRKDEKNLTTTLFVCIMAEILNISFYHVS